MSIDYDPCQVCVDETAKTIPSASDTLHQDCPRCGEFKLTGTAAGILSHGLGKKKRALLSGWIREQNNAGSTPFISSDNLESILAQPLPSVADRAMGLLLEAERGITGLGEGFNIGDSRFLAATYSSEPSDVIFLLTVLSDQGLANATTFGGESTISPTGYMKLDELRRQPSASTQGFVAMWFHDDLSTAFSDGFQKGIFDAGYNPVRVDQVEHINKIDDEIIRQINASKFLVADFTGHRGGVYFEAGYAMGQGIPVFWTCQKESMSELHFDIRQFNCIDWEEPSDLSERLSKRLEAVLGLGPNYPLAR